jgi:methyl-accepting chemotaxis protein
MRSAEAAKNTASMIEEAVKNSKNGVDIAAEVRKVLDEIVQTVGKTTDLVSEIAAASQEQAQGIDQVNTAVTQMDKVTQQNAANAEESASASEELSSQAESMNEIVGELVALAGGATRHQGSNKGRQGGQGRKLAHSDRVLHHIAEGTAKHVPATNGVKSAAEKAIPLGGEDSKLEHFNT